MQDTQTLNLWTVGGEIDWDYQISVGTVSENTDDESDDLDKFSVISRSEILDVELFSDDESASKMEVDEEKVPEAASALVARSETIEPRRVSLKDFMRQNSSLATDLPDSIPEAESDISQAIEQTAKGLQIGTEVKDIAPTQPENSSSGGISEHEEGSIINANGDSIEISESNDHDFFQNPSSARTRPVPLNYRPPYVIPPAPVDPSQQQRRDPDAGYGWERHDSPYYRSQESFPPPKRPQSADRLYMERREYANSQIDLRLERARIIPHNRPPPRTAYRPEPPWQDHTYRPAPRDYRGEGPRFDSPREYWNEPGQAPAYSRDPWRDRYPPPEYRETLPSRRMNAIPYEYRQDRFRPPLASEAYRPPPRDIEREREFQYRDQRERDARIYRPYPGKPRPEYGRPRQ